jgi:hypothetical protein
MGIMAAVPTVVDDNHYDRGYYFTTNTTKILEAGDKAIFVESVTALKTTLEADKGDLDFPFLQFIEVSAKNTYHRYGAESEEPLYVPSETVYILKHPRLILNWDDVEKKFEDVVRAVLKYKSVRMPGDPYHLPGDLSDRFLKHSLMYNTRRSWKLRNLLEYRPRVAARKRNEAKVPKYYDWYQDIPLNWNFLRSIPNAVVEDVKPKLPKPMRAFIYSPSGGDFSIEWICEIVACYKRKMKVIISGLHLDDVKNLQEACKKVIVYKTPKNTRMSKDIADRLVKHKKDAETLLALCKILNGALRRVKDATRPVAKDSVLRGKTAEN